MDKSQLWATYTKTRKDADRNSLIVAYEPLVRATAKKIKNRLPPSVELDDLVSYGMFGLIDAIERFDMSRGFKFETFALKRIQGAIYDGIRVMDWVPRTVRSQSRKLDTAVSEFIRDNQRQPTDDELLVLLDWTAERLQRVREQMSASMVALDEVIPGQDETTTIGDLIADVGNSPGLDLELQDLQDSLVEAIRNLSDRDRTILALYYQEQMKFSEIGGLFGVSESRICQIHMSAIETVKRKMINRI